MGPTSSDEIPNYQYAMLLCGENPNYLVCCVTEAGQPPLCGNPDKTRAWVTQYLHLFSHEDRQGLNSHVDLDREAGRAGGWSVSQVKDLPARLSSHSGWLLFTLYLHVSFAELQGHPAPASA